MEHGSIPLSDHASERIKHMVTWSLVAELMRRHKPRRDLRVFEMHPGGGQGDTLGLYDCSEPKNWKELNDFRGFRRMGEDHHTSTPLEEQGGYVWPWLQAEDTKEIVDAVERACGLPHYSGRLPPSNPTIKTFRLMAQLLFVACSCRRNFQWRSAVFDSSGMMGGGLRPTFESLDHICSLLPRGTHLMRYNRFWLLVPGPRPDWGQPGPVLAVADLAGSFFVGKGCRRQFHVVDLFEKHGGPIGAAAALWAALP